MKIEKLLAPASFVNNHFKAASLGGRIIMLLGAVTSISLLYLLLDRIRQIVVERFEKGFSSLTPQESIPDQAYNPSTLLRICITYLSKQEIDSSEPNSFIPLSAQLAEQWMQEMQPQSLALNPLYLRLFSHSHTFDLTKFVPPFTDEQLKEILTFLDIKTVIIPPYLVKQFLVVLPNEGTKFELIITDINSWGDMDELEHSHFEKLAKIAPLQFNLLKSLTSKSSSSFPLQPLSTPSSFFYLYQEWFGNREFRSLPPFSFRSSEPLSGLNLSRDFSLHRPKNTFSDQAYQEILNDIWRQVHYDSPTRPLYTQQEQMLQNSLDVFRRNNALAIDRLGNQMAPSLSHSFIYQQTIDIVNSLNGQVTSFSGKLGNFGFEVFTPTTNHKRLWTLEIKPLVSGPQMSKMMEDTWRQGHHGSFSSEYPVWIISARNVKTLMRKAFEKMNSSASKERPISHGGVIHEAPFLTF